MGELRYEEIRVELGERVATVTLDRPEVLNAITPRMLEELNDAFDHLEGESRPRVVILTGAGRAFSAGVDLGVLGERRLENGKVGDILDVPARRLTNRIERGPWPVIARVNGACFTGALELVLACDLVVVDEEAKLGDTHARWGLRPTWGMSQRLPRMVGWAAARELSYTARTFTGAEAARLGLANRAVPGERLDEAVGELVEAICANSRGSIEACKDLYRVARQRPLDEGLRYEARTEYPIDDTEERLAAFRG